MLPGADLGRFMRAEYLAQFDRTRLPFEAASRWRAEDIQHVQDSESFVYSVMHEGKPAFLRVTHSGHRCREQILAELQFVAHLAGRGVPVARPIPSAGGTLVESVQGEQAIFHACLFVAAPGDRFAFRSMDGDCDTVRRWGQLLGMIHASSMDYVPTGVRRLRWDADEVWVRAGDHLPAAEVSARHELDMLRSWLAQQQESGEQFGLLHGDLCAANFQVKQETLTVFDFDDCCYHWFMYDIVCALAPQIARSREERQAIRKAFIDGYLTQRSLARGWEFAFDQFLRLRGLYLFILNIRNWNSDLADHPKRGFLEFLRTTFEEPIRW
jgi:Ser/Thr protein kinase RdoA (MazF antagonist)